MPDVTSPDVQLSTSRISSCRLIWSGLRARHACSAVHPPSVGLDQSAFKAVFIAREQHGKRAEAVATVVIDRLIGLYVLFVVASVAALWTGMATTDVCSPRNGLPGLLRNSGPSGRGHNSSSPDPNEPRPLSHPSPGMRPLGSPERCPRDVRRSRK